jgi:hypothetical protein
MHAKSLDTKMLRRPYFCKLGDILPTFPLPFRKKKKADVKAMPGIHKFHPAVGNAGFPVPISKRAEPDCQRVKMHVGPASRGGGPTPG